MTSYYMRYFNILQLKHWYSLPVEDVNHLIISASNLLFEYNLSFKLSVIYVNSIIVILLLENV